MNSWQYGHTVPRADEVANTGLKLLIEIWQNLLSMIFIGFSCYSSGVFLQLRERLAKYYPQQRNAKKKRLKKNIHNLLVHLYRVSNIQLEIDLHPFLKINNDWTASASWNIQVPSNNNTVVYGWTLYKNIIPWLCKWHI